MDHQGGPLRNSQAYADVVERKWGMQREHVGTLRLAHQREGIRWRDRSRSQRAERSGQLDRRRPGHEMTSPAAHARRQHAAGDPALAGARQHADDLRYAAIDFRMAHLIRVQNVHTRPTNLSGHSTPTKPPAKLYRLSYHEIIRDEQIAVARRIVFAHLHQASAGLRDEREQLRLGEAVHFHVVRLWRLQKLAQVE